MPPQMNSPAHGEKVPQPERSPAHPQSAGCSERAALTIDDTTVHVAAAPGEARRLLDWFRAAGVPCRLRQGQMIAGRELIDFGDPTPAQEMQIRTLFMQWLQQEPSEL